MVSPTLRVMDWFPGRATLPQVALGAALLLAVTALSLYWAAGETSTGHRVFLWSIAALAFCWRWVEWWPASAWSVRATPDPGEPWARRPALLTTGGRGGFGAPGEPNPPRQPPWRDRISPDVGTPVPAVTRTCGLSSSGTGFTEGPRIWRTASAMPFMPCR